MDEFITGKLFLKSGREKPVKNRHPWVFSGAIHHIEGNPAPGTLVHVVDSNGRYLATAYYNPHSQIQGRILTWTDEAIDDAFWHRKIERAIAGRALLNLEPATNAYRLINAEADELPGLVVDKYGDYLVIQCLTMGIDRRKEMITAVLANLLQPTGIIERSDANVRAKEGLENEIGVLWGETPETAVTIQENGHTFGVNLLTGHKTGFYLDQRDNRALVGRPEFVQGKAILNVFAYTGGFAVYAAAHGAASIINVDSSREALEQAEENMGLNGQERPFDEYLLGDAFEVLRDYRDNGRLFDMVILDPPKFVHSKQDIDKASRGYKDLNWLAL
ncbi:MAG: class I SAM-dependent rRNA methyltransferase, partial [Anaerolineae bacterium]|nr:class I SAM-dependent rRNA methyltransferase [Anaerolineae bacterium]